MAEQTAIKTEESHSNESHIYASASNKYAKPCIMISHQDMHVI